MCRGAISPWYIGTSSEQAPTPNPVTNRPIMNWYHFPAGEEIWMISPTWRMIHQKKMDHFRPIRSVNGPARRAPIKVPMESWKALAFLTFISVFSSFQRYATISTHHGNNQSRPDIVKPIRPIRFQLRKPLLEVTHLQKARDLASIISKNDTTNRDKGA